MQNQQVSPGPATPKTERQEIVLQDVFTDRPLTLSRENNDLVRLTYGGISRTTDIDASDLLLAAQMLARDSQADVDKEILRDIMSYSNGTLTTNAFLQRIKVILAPAPEPRLNVELPTSNVEHRSPDSDFKVQSSTFNVQRSTPSHSAKLYRLLDQVAAERVRQRADVQAGPPTEIDLANPRTENDIKLRILSIALGDLATTIDVMDLSQDQSASAYRSAILRAELAEKLIQLAAHAVAWCESIPEEAS